MGACHPLGPRLWRGSPDSSGPKTPGPRTPAQTPSSAGPQTPSTRSKSSSNSIYDGVLVGARNQELELVHIFQAADANGDGTISCDEFSAIVQAQRSCHLDDLDLFIRTFDSLQGIQWKDFVAHLVIERGSKRKKSLHDVMVDNALMEIPTGVRICILGGTQFADPGSPGLVKALASTLSERFKDGIVVVTGGLPGVQQSFAEGVSEAFARKSLVNLVPTGVSSEYGVGRDVCAGANAVEKNFIMGAIGRIYISIEGGPGVAKEAKAAVERGAVVLPMMSTGGASSGMFSFPPDALEQSRYASSAQWALLQAGAPPEDVAGAVVDIITNIINDQGVPAPAPAETVEAPQTAQGAPPLAPVRVAPDLREQLPTDQERSQRWSLFASCGCPY